MTGARAFDVFDITRLGDSLGNIGGVKMYSGSILPFLRTPQYDALALGMDDDQSPELVYRCKNSTAICNRITSGELSMRGIIPRHALERPRDDTEKAVAIQVSALHFLARLVQGGADVRIASAATDNPIPSEAENFALIEYQDGRRGDLIAATAAGNYFVMAKEDESAFARASGDFTTAWEAPSTLKTVAEVSEYLTHVASTLAEQKLAE